MRRGGGGREGEGRREKGRIKMYVIRIEKSDEEISKSKNGKGYFCLKKKWIYSK